MFHLICIGAQKSGTSWLHHQLDKSDFSFSGGYKEWKIIDKYYSYELHRQENNLLVPNLRKTYPAEHQYLAGIFLRDIGNYFEFFKSALKLNKQLQFSMDFSPSYALVNQRSWKDLIIRAQNKDLPLKIVFIMRDPLERIVSQFKMKLKHYGAPLKAVDKQAFNNYFRSFYRGPKVEARTRYEWTIEQIESAFGNQSIHFMFYEDLFNHKTLLEFQKFLGVSVNFSVDEKVGNSNYSLSASDLHQSLYNEAVEYYMSTYSYIYKRFKNVPVKWEKPKTC